MARAILIFVVLALMAGGGFAWAVRSQPQSVQAASFSNGGSPIPGAGSRITTKYDEFRSETDTELDLTPGAKSGDVYIRLIHTTRGKSLTGESLDYPRLFVFKFKARGSASPELLIEGKASEIKGDVLSYQQLRDIAKSTTSKLRLFGTEVVEFSAKQKSDIAEYLKVMGR